LLCLHSRNITALIGSGCCSRPDSHASGPVELRVWPEAAAIQLESGFGRIVQTAGLLFQRRSIREAQPKWRVGAGPVTAEDLPQRGFSGLLAFLAHIETLLGVRSPVKCLLV
jgi:hypothetical protein